MATKRNPAPATEPASMTIEVHSTEKKTKEGNKFRSYFATAVGGEDLARPMSVVFTAKSGGKPRAAHAILTIDPLIESSYGKDRYTGRPAIFVSDPYTEKAIEPRKTAQKLCPPSKWTDGKAVPEAYVPEQYGGEQIGFEAIADDEALPFDIADPDAPDCL